VKDFVRRLVRALAAAPSEIVAGLWRLLLILILLLLRLLFALWDLLRRLWHKEEEDSERSRCEEVPPHVKRKPDPCLYSQFYLASLGLAVTWDNPDIWITLPDGTPADSYHLDPNRDYLVHARISDASFDPALATEVRCLYRPWSFGTPDRIPVELNPDGTERVAILHIPPWQSEIATFRWHTPNTGQHYCLQVECRHPDDKNPNNNLGQENTNLVQAGAGDEMLAPALLWNPAVRPVTYRIVADGYQIPERRVDLRLEQRERKLIRRRPFQGVYDLMLTRDARVGLKTTRGRALTTVAYAYRGWDPVRQANGRGQPGDRPAWPVFVDGLPTDHDPAAVTVEPQEVREVALSVRVPPDAVSDTAFAFNFSAYSPTGKLAGGVTLRIEVA
jgi:hypothetical protein